MSAQDRGRTAAKKIANSSVGKITPELTHEGD
jgi:hypothetical protein